MKHYDLRRHIANIAEDHAAIDLIKRGFDPQSNGYHGHADFTVNGSLRVEVKASTWVSKQGRAGRYQFNTRNGPDVYLLYCIGTLGHCFVIPGRAIGNRRNVAITSKDVSAYSGQWSVYLEAWDIIEQELEKCLTRH